MKRTVLALAMLTMPFAANAQWVSATDEDPMTDEKTAILFGGTDSKYALGFKCWEKNPSSTLVIFETGDTYKDENSYPKTIDIVIRVDKGERRTFSLYPKKSANGSLQLLNDADEIPAILTVIKEIGSAKTHVALAVADQIITIPAKGSSINTAKFLKTCSID